MGRGDRIPGVSSMSRSSPRFHSCAGPTRISPPGGTACCSLPPPAASTRRRRPGAHSGRSGSAPAPCDRRRDSGGHAPVCGCCVWPTRAHRKRPRAPGWRELPSGPGGRLLLPRICPRVPSVEVGTWLFSSPPPSAAWTMPEDHRGFWVPRQVHRVGHSRHPEFERPWSAADLCGTTKRRGGLTRERSGGRAPQRSRVTARGTRATERWCRP
jgi:hypothetical protein